MEWDVRFDPAFAAEAGDSRGPFSSKSQPWRACFGDSDRSFDGRIAIR